MFCIGCIGCASYVIIGPGRVSCGTWLQDSNSKSPLYYAQSAWIAGFVTAFNYYMPLDTKGADVNGMEAWITGYCSQNPLDNLAKASAALVKELQTRSQN
jgi:hypothetical protein